MSATPTVQTVTGFARAADLGRTLSHDSIVCWRGRPVPFAQNYDDVLAMLPEWRSTTILRKIVPQLLEGGLTPEDIETILVANPRRLFTNA